MPQRAFKGAPPKWDDSRCPALPPPAAPRPPLPRSPQLSPNGGHGGADKEERGHVLSRLGGGGQVQRPHCGQEQARSRGAGTGTGTLSEALFSERHVTPAVRPRPSCWQAKAASSLEIEKRGSREKGRNCKGTLFKEERGSKVRKQQGVHRVLHKTWHAQAYSARRWRQLPAGQGCPRRPSLQGRRSNETTRSKEEHGSNK